MSTFSVIEAKPRHVGAVLHNIRRAHIEGTRRLGLDQHRLLRDAFETSSFRRSWMIDGRPAAIGGVTGSLMCSSGLVWLAVTEAATQFPLEMVKEARRQLGEILLVKTRLDSAIVLGDEAAWRFARFLGFSLKMPLGDGRWKVLRRLPPQERSLEGILRAEPDFLPAGGRGVLIGVEAGAFHG